MRIKIISLLLIAAGFIGMGRFAHAEKMDKIIAIVNGDIITEEDVSLFARMATELEHKDMESLSLQEQHRYILDRIIEDRLILQEARRKNLRIDDRAIENRINEIRRKSGSERAFEQALKAQGYSLKDLREKLKNQYLIFALIQKQVKDKVTVSPKEVTQYYEKNKDKYVTPEGRLVDSIFVVDSEELKTVEARLNEGKDFYEVAKAYSQRASLGIVSRGQLKKELEDFIYNLEIGKRSKPVSVEGGFYILLVREKLPPSAKTLENVKDVINDELSQEKTEKLLKEWLESLKDQAYISIRE